VRESDEEINERVNVNGSHGQHARGLTIYLTEM
jgi:hypothetical protein